MKKIRVLVIDHSFLMRRSISSILNSDPDIEVVATAMGYEDALEKVKRLKPDAITLNLEMPGISGLDILHQVMLQQPTPTIVMSSRTELGAEETTTAFAYGAVDFIAKPRRAEDMWKIKDELIALVQTAASAEIKMLLIPKPKKIIEGPRTSKKVVVVGASSGGPPAVESILAQFPGDFPAPLLVVQHMPPYFTRSFAKRLNRVCLIRVKEAEEGDRLEPGQALVAPGGHNVGLRKKVNKLFVKLSKGRGGLTPSVDLALESVARYCDGDAIAVILTGMGSDGSRGVRLIKEEGGKVICQDMATSLIFGMPARVIEQGNADFVLPLRRIGKKIVELL